MNTLAGMSGNGRRASARRSAGCGPGGHGFESRHPPQSSNNLEGGPSGGGLPGYRRGTAASCPVRERSIIFSGTKVRYILTQPPGTEIQTRRFLHEASGTFWGHAAYRPAFRLDGTWGWYVIDSGEDAYHAPAFRCRYGVPGDRLWVRETWCPIPDAKPRGYFLDPEWKDRRFFYSADNNKPTWAPTWRPSIFMPRAASRLTLELIEVRVQRLQEISEEDAKAEGALWHDGGGVGHSGYRHDPNHGYVWGTARESFGCLWERINGRRSHGWDSNPYVWALTFRRLAGEVTK
jgi:hypothetical protein